MHPESLPPMAGSSDECHHHDHHHPHPKHDLVCIEAKKVYDFCFQEHQVERIFHEAQLPDCTNVKVICSIDEENITCRELEPRRPIEGKEGKFLVCLGIEVPVTLRFVDEYHGHPIGKVSHRTVVFAKQVVLCAPRGTQVQCHVTGNCCCVYDKPNKAVVCEFDFCVVVQSKADVKMLVPSYGQCVPAKCQGLALGCPPQVPPQCDRQKWPSCDC